MKEFLCNDCGKQFKRKDKLREHVIRMHNVDQQQQQQQQQNDKQSHNINNNNEKKIGQPQKNGTKENKFVPKVHFTNTSQLCYYYLHENWQHFC